MTTQERKARVRTQSSTRHLQVQQQPIAQLVPYARNARIHSDAQVAQIAASIAEFGFNNPVLIDPTGGIIAGHGRVLAARKLGHQQVPVIVLGHLKENQKRAFMLADNQLALNAAWNPELLRLELEALAAQDFPLEFTGFTEEDLKRLIARQDRDPEQVPAPQSTALIQRGELWRLGKHRLLCGDGTSREDVNRALGAVSCQMVFTDLPYNVDYQGKTRAKMKLANDHLGARFAEFLLNACRAMIAVAQGPLYVCMSSSELHRLHAAFSQAGGHWSTYIIWAKNTFTLGRSDYQRQYEPILYGWREGVKRFWCGARNQGDVWQIDKPVRNDLHPTMKPVALIEQALRNSSRAGDLILDPFAGSGSTLIACENLSRSACLIELDPRYADVIVRRWQQYTGQPARRETDGREFDEIASEGKAR